MWWLSLGMWWLSWGDVVAQFGDVVAQLAKATGRHQTEDAAVPGSNPALPQSPERGQDIDCVSYKTKISASKKKHYYSIVQEKLNMY
jgi:hypothetical protein